jgi:hypothetical protein
MESSTMPVEASATSWLDGMTALYPPGASPLIRWEVWTGRPVFSRHQLLVVAGERQQDDVAETTVQKALSPRPLPLALVIFFFQVLIATTVRMIVWAFIPFAVLWGIGALIGHPPTFVTAIRVLAFAQLLFVLRYLAAWLASRDEHERGDAERGMAQCASFLLPLLMYTTAAPGAMHFSIFEPHEYFASQGLLSWMLFYGYMFLNLVFLETPEALLGDLGALQPASLWATLSTFLIHSVMAVGIVWYAVEYGKDRLIARHEFVGTLEQVLRWIDELERPIKNIFLVPRGIEQPFPETYSALPVQQVIDAAHDKGHFLPTFKPPGKWFARAMLFSQGAMVNAALTLLLALVTLGLALLPWHLNKIAYILPLALYIFLSIAVQRARMTALRVADMAREKLREQQRMIEEVNRHP